MKRKIFFWLSFSLALALPVYLVCQSFGKGQDWMGWSALGIMVLVVPLYFLILRLPRGDIEDAEAKDWGLPEVNVDVPMPKCKPPKKGEKMWDEDSILGQMKAMVGYIEDCLSKNPLGWVNCMWCEHSSFPAEKIKYQRPLTVEHLIPEPWPNGERGIITKEVSCRICGGYGSVIIEGGKIHRIDEYIDMDALTKGD